MRRGPRKRTSGSSPRGPSADVAWRYTQSANSAKEYKDAGWRCAASGRSVGAGGREKLKMGRGSGMGMGMGMGWEMGTGQKMGGWEMQVGQEMGVGTKNGKRGEGIFGRWEWG